MTNKPTPASQPCRNVLMRAGYSEVPKSCPRCGDAAECPLGHARSVRDTSGSQPSPARGDSVEAEYRCPYCNVGEGGDHASNCRFNGEEVSSAASTPAGGAQERPTDGGLKAEFTQYVRQCAADSKTPLPYSEFVAERAPSGDEIATWESRMGPGYVDGGMDLPEEVAMKAEIADLRAALARRATAVPSGKSIDADQTFHDLHGAWMSQLDYHQSEDAAPVRAAWAALVAHIDTRRATAGNAAPTGEKA